MAAIDGGLLDPSSVTKLVTPMLIPPAMPRAGKVRRKMAKNIDYCEIAMRQFRQQILPPGHPKTLVVRTNPATVQGGPVIVNAPSLTIGAKRNKPVRITWVNGLMDPDGNYLPRRMPVDQGLHWANPARGTAGRDTRHDITGQTTPGNDDGPVLIVTHMHGAVGVGDESEGCTEARYLPAANDIPDVTEGTWYDFFKGGAAGTFGESWDAGSATIQDPNDNRASTIWYHDHALGLMRLNVYAGPAGFFIIRGGPAMRCWIRGRPRQVARPRSCDRRSGGSDVPRDPLRQPGPGVQHRRFLLLPRDPGVLR